MELRDYIRISRQRGWIIILLIVMTAAAAFGFSKLQTPIYKSSVDILVQPARPDFGLTQSAKILLRSYVSWMNTEVRAKKVIDQLDLDLTPGKLRSKVAIASDESRLVIQITVENNNGDVANDIARVWRDLFIQWRNDENSQLRKEDQMMAIALDEPDYGLFSPNVKINVAAGAIFGTLLGGVIVFVLEWIESGVVRRPDDVDRFLGMPLLGAIPAPKLDTSRPYLLGGRRASVPALAPPAPAALPPATPAPQPAVTPAVELEPEPVLLPAVEPEQAPQVVAQPVESPPAEPAAQSEPEPAPQPEPEPVEETPPPPPQAEDEAGPIEPTILYSKGDEL